MSSHSEKLLAVELELRSLHVLRDEMENLRGTLDNVRTRLNALEQGGRSGSGATTQTLGQTHTNTHTHWTSKGSRDYFCRSVDALSQLNNLIDNPCNLQLPWRLR